MKSISSALLFLVSVPIHQIGADFHISSLMISGVDGGLIACPSNYLNCDCWINGDRGQLISGDPDSLGAFFQVDEGLCGLGYLNFYEGAGGVYDFYMDGGDGTLQGQCFPNSFTDHCSHPSATVVDQLVCYSYICGN